MTSRKHRIRCRICGTVPNRIFVRVLQFGFRDGWCRREVLCQPCARYLFEAIADRRAVPA